MQEYELQQTLFRQNILNQKHFISFTHLFGIFFFSQQRENSTVMKTIEILETQPFKNKLNPNSYSKET